MDTGREKIDSIDFDLVDNNGNVAMPGVQLQARHSLKDDLIRELKKINESKAKEKDRTKSKSPMKSNKKVAV